MSRTIFQSILSIGLLLISLETANSQTNYNPPYWNMPGGNLPPLSSALPTWGYGGTGTGMEYVPTTGQPPGTSVAIYPSYSYRPYYHFNRQYPRKKRVEPYIPTPKYTGRSMANTVIRRALTRGLGF